MPTIYLFNNYESRKTKLCYLWWLFQRSRDPYGCGFRRLKLLREKNKTSKHERISSYQWIISVSLFPPNCVAVVILRRFFIYDVNFVYNALCFLRLASPSSVNHIFIVLNKHILYLVVAKFPALFSSPFARCLLWAQGTENIKVLYHRFSYY